MKLRHELKIPINSFDREVLRRRLGACLRRDGNVGADGTYLVRSLYFDTPGDAALREKIAGVDRREKFRIRIYPEMGRGRIVLEKKVKVHGLSGKAGATLGGDEYLSILEGDISWMAGDGRELVRELYAKMRGSMLRPKTIVEYRREPFVYDAGNVRVTIDSDIRTGIFSKELFLCNPAYVPAAGGLIVLEVKYDAFIPDFVEGLLRLGDRHASACSKYTIARRFG